MPQEWLRRISADTWRLGIFFLICIVGIFFRTVHFHDWLTFRDDQARDAALVGRVASGEVAWPTMGPYMSYSGDNNTEENSFHLGPIYYSFQIVSAKIFGDDPSVMAYPDALFGILAVPLLYFFLKLYFREGISLGIAGVFSVSSYFIQYSRFAWNTNLIPFFVLLFLFSLHRLLESAEGYRWRWAIALGLAMGVGVQLHVILAGIFLLCAGITAAYSLRTQRGAWKEWVLVVCVILLSNAGQVASEWRTDFRNTRILFADTSQRSALGMRQLTVLTFHDLDCFIETHAYFISSYGSSACSYEALDPATYARFHTETRMRFMRDARDMLAMLLAVIFSAGGYALLIRDMRRETDEKKKRFLSLISLYMGIAFLVMIPLSKEKFSDMRYLTPIFFMSFVILGFIVSALMAKFPRRKTILSGGIFLLLLITNGQAIAEQAVPLISGQRTCNSHATTLGEIEPIADRIASHASGQRMIALRGDRDLHVIFDPLSYLLAKRGIESIEMDSKLRTSDDIRNAYLVSCTAGYRDEYPFETIGDFLVFHIMGE